MGESAAMVVDGLRVAGQNREASRHAEFRFLQVVEDRRVAGPFATQFLHQAKRNLRVVHHRCSIAAQGDELAMGPGQVAADLRRSRIAGERFFE
jgi:hypothetical protein